MPAPIVAAAARGAAALGQGVRAGGQATVRVGQRVVQVAGRTMGRGAVQGARGAAHGAKAGARNAAKRGRPPTRPGTGRPPRKNPSNRGPGRGKGQGRPEPKKPLKKGKKGLRGQLEELKPNVKARAQRRAKKAARDQARDLLGESDEKKRRKQQPNILQGDGAARAAGRLAKQTPGKAVRFVGKRLRRLVIKKDAEKVLKKTKKVRKLVVRLALVNALILVTLILLPVFMVYMRLAGNSDAKTLALRQQLVGQTAAGMPGAIPAAMLPQVALATGIPIEALSAYSSAAGKYPIEWVILAGVGWAECEHGTYQGAGCNPRGSVNEAGARGPMQHVGDIWRTSAGKMDADVSGPPSPEGAHYSVGFASDGDGDGNADPWNWYDAAHGAAREMTTYRQELLQAGDKYQDWKWTIAAYNAGVGGVKSAGGSMPTTETAAHNRKALAEIERIRKAVKGIDLGPGDFGPPPAGARTVQTANGPINIVDIKMPASYKGETLTVNVEIAAQVQAMINQASSENVPLISVSSFRTFEEQIASRKRNCGTSHYDIYEKPSGQCSTPVAIPGHSRHERGLAIDFGCAGYSLMTTSTKCYKWLVANAAGYGLKVLTCGEIPPCEPWHWSKDGH